MERTITKDVIIGAVCVYFLIGVIWGIFFILLENHNPRSFQINQDHLKNAAGFVYYSFVTLTTLGYGDRATAWQAKLKACPPPAGSGF